MRATSIPLHEGGRRRRRRRRRRSAAYIVMVARIPLCVQMRRVHGLNSSPASEAVAGREPTIKRDGEKRGYEHQAVILPATTVPCSVSNIGSCVPRLAWIVSFVPRREKKKAYGVCECVKWTHVTTSSSRVCALLLLAV